jgi:hypothetical protein
LKKFPVPTNDVYDIFNEFKNLFGDTPNSYYWYEKLVVSLSPLMTYLGLCHTFNMAYSNDTFYLDNVSKNFHYGHFKKNVFMQGIETGFPTQTTSSEKGLKLRLFFSRDEDFNVNATEIKQKTISVSVL